MQTTSHTTSSVPRLLRLPDVLKRVGLSRAQVYKLIAQDRFPKQVKIGQKVSAWNSLAIDDWITSLIRGESL